MRSIVQDIQSEFRRFIDSKRETLMIISCEPEHSALLLKSIEALDDDPESLDIFFIFGHQFADAERYVREILPTINLQLTNVNKELDKRGDPALPPLPPGLMDESQKPPIRLAGLMRYVESLVTDERHVIWALCPLEIGDPSAYYRLIGYINDELKPASLPKTKLIARDSVTSPILEKRLADQPNVKIYRPGLDPESFEKKLNEKANDPQVPMEEHAQLQMMLAGYDVANQRYDMALARNLELSDYFGYTGQKHQQAIVLNNIGDLHYTQKKFKEAQTWYERAINISVKLESEPLVLYQSFNLGNALLMQNRFADALVYYNAMEQLAGATNLPIQQIQALEQMGMANYRMGKTTEAGQHWEKAVELSRDLNFEEGQRTNLMHLQELYKKLGDSTRLAACKAALSELQSSKS
jgi:tetratricopeptide (TPR) repeat protein